MSTEYIKIRLFCHLMMTLVGDDEKLKQAFYRIMNSEEAKQMTLEEFQSALSPGGIVSFLSPVDFEGAPDA